MNEQELRLLVRAAVARHVGAASAGGAVCDAPVHSPAGHPQFPAPGHMHQALYTGLVNVSDACVIEPAVSCDHCGYCKSHGF